MSSTEPIAPPRCYVHTDRIAGSVCRRCGRPICPDCMHEAPVGWQCTACLREGARVAPTVRWRPRPPGRLGATRITPVVTALIVVNVAAFLWEETDVGSIERRFAMWPNGVHYLHQWYRLVTSAFLHVGFEHIFLNMLTLAIVGPAVEAEIGRLRFVVLYLLAAVGGSVGFYLLAGPAATAVGASGAIFGVMGAYYVLARLRRWDVQTITVLLGINLVYSFAVPGVGWQAHLGGLVVGALVCWGLVAQPRSAPGPGEVVQVVQGLAVVIASAVVLGLLTQLPPGQISS